MPSVQLLSGHVLDVLKTLPDESVDCCVTSPPYWNLRDYGTEPQIWYNTGGTEWRGHLGLEPQPEMYVEHLAQIFREVKRVLKKDGTLWLNLGDSYMGSGGQNANFDHTLESRRTLQKRIKLIDIDKLPSQNKHPYLKPKDLVGIPWRVAFALQQDGWYLRSDIIWSKSNPMPESVKDRPTKSHEYIFLLSKSPEYHYDREAILEPLAVATLPRMKRGVSETNKWANGAPGSSAHSLSQPRLNAKLIGRTTNKYDGTGYAKDGRGLKEWSGEADGHSGYFDKDGKPRFNPKGRNKRTVWTISTKPFKGAHFATYPPDLIEPCILAGSPVDGVVLDPFSGSGTTGYVAVKHGRSYIGIDLKEEYHDMARKRLETIQVELI